VLGKCVLGADALGRRAGEKAGEDRGELKHAPIVTRLFKPC
jgi:hypothetical protein